MFVGLIALIENAVAVAPVVRRSSVSHAWIISTLAYSLIIDNLVGHAWGPDPIRVDPPAPLSMTTFTIAGVRTSSYQLALIVATALMILLIERFYRTRSGKAVMAVAEDRDAALLRGIDPGRLSRWSFFLGGGFAAVAGLLASPVLYASTQLGPALLVKGFEAAAIGGVGNNRGALVAGWILGLAEALGGSVLSPVPTGVHLRAAAGDPADPAARPVRAAGSAQCLIAPSRAGARRSCSTVRGWDARPCWCWRSPSMPFR